MKTKTQKQRLIEAFLRGEKLTTHSANSKRLTTKLPSRLGELSKEGYCFHKTWLTPKGIKAHYVYFLDRVKTNQKLLK